MSTESFGDLILNALALEFIIGIDELLLHSFFPERMLKNISMTQWTHVKKELTPQEVHQGLIADYHRSIFMVGAALLWVYLYIFHLQQVLPFYTHDVPIDDCSRFIEESFAPLCGYFEGG